MGVVASALITELIGIQLIFGAFILGQANLILMGWHRPAFSIAVSIRVRT
jgi:hypothetical protein